MTHNTPLSPRPLHDLSGRGRLRVMTVAQLRAHGVSTAQVNEQCTPAALAAAPPRRRPAPPGPPTSEERLHAVLRYAARERGTGVPAQPGADGSGAPAHPEAMITGLAALTLHGFSSTPPLPSLDVIDVLVPRMRRLRSTGCARIVRGVALPVPEQVTGLPVAPVARALADAVAGLADAVVVRRLMTEAVRAPTASRPRWCGS
ncbi:hypothetical protein GCM10011428_13560 [Streptomyces violaceus]